MLQQPCFRFMCTGEIRDKQEMLLHAASFPCNVNTGYISCLFTALDAVSGQCWLLGGEAAVHMHDEQLS